MAFDDAAGAAVPKPAIVSPDDRLERIGNFLDRLASIPTRDHDRIWSEALNELKYLKTAERRGWSGANHDRTASGTDDPRAGKYAISTIRGVLTDYREAVRGDPRFGPNHPVLDYLRPSNADQVEARKTQMNNVVERSAPDSRRPIDAEAFTDTAMRLLDEPYLGKGVPAKAVALALLTGRRPLELFRDELSPAQGGDPILAGAGHSVLHFTGQAKSGKEAGAVVAGYDIPVLGDPDRILAAFHQLRREYPLAAGLRTERPEISDRELNTAINSKTASSMVKIANQNFADERGDPLSPSELRKSYVVIAFDWYARELSLESKPSFNAFAGHILGNSGVHDVATALALQQFEIAGQAEAFSDEFMTANVSSGLALEEAAGAVFDKRREFMLADASAFRAAALREAAERGLSSVSDSSAPSRPVLFDEPRADAEGIRQPVTLGSSFFYHDSAQTRLSRNDADDQRPIVMRASSQGTQLDGEEVRRNVVSLEKGVTMQTTDDEASLANGSAAAAAIETPAADLPGPAVQAQELSEPPTIEAAASGPAAPEPEKEPRDKDVRNKVDLVGTLQNVTPPRNASSPTRFDVQVGKSTIPVSAFRDAAKSVGELEPGSKVKVDGYLATRPVTVENKDTGIATTRMITGVTANAVSQADPNEQDRNSVFVRGNTGQDPIFKPNQNGNERGDFAAVSVAMGKRNDTVLFTDVVGFGDVAASLRDTVGQGDAVAVEGRANLKPPDRGFPATIQIIASDVEVERKKEPKLELTGTLVRDPVVNVGPAMQQVNFRIDTGREGDDRFKNVQTFAEKDQTWPSNLKAGMAVDVVGKEAVREPREEGQRPYEYIKAQSVTLSREQQQTQSVDVAPASEPASAAPPTIVDAVADEPRPTPAQTVAETSAVIAAPTVEIDPDDLADEAAAAVATTEVAEPLGSSATTPTVAAQATEQRSVDIDALTEQIENTEWGAGPEATRETLAAITTAAQIDPIETGNLIDRFAESNAPDQDPALAAIIGEMKGAVAAGVEQRLDAMMPEPEVSKSSLPIFEPGPNEIVSDRSSKRMVLDQQMVVEARSADGETIFGRKDGLKGSPVIGVSRDAFSQEPQQGQEVSIRRVGGKDIAEPLAPELALDALER